MGHSCQSASILARADKTSFAVPLGIKIHEVLIFFNHDKRTLLDEMTTLFFIQEGKQHGKLLREDVLVRGHFDSVVKSL